MTTPRWQGSGDEAPSPGRRAFRSGTLLIIGLLVFLLVGWLFYRQTLPAAWLHDFSGAIAYHAAADPNPPEPEDIRQVAPPSEADSPYICAADAIDLDWDRMFVVTSRQSLRNHPHLGSMRWPDESLARHADQLSRDARYQLIVLTRGDEVLDAQLFFTFWGDLSALARSEGYDRSEAVFTAASRGGIYIVSPASGAPPSACP